MTIVDTSRQPASELPFFIRFIKQVRKLPFSVGFGIAWLVAMVLVAFLADLIRPYGITAMDLRARL
jgi:peptide/nickel transport system permease protein